MSIEFHCEHCGKVIKAPKETAGKRGKCPHCQGVCYIPSPPEDAETYDLAPIDPEAERRRAREEAAAHALQRKLLHERGEIKGADAAPREPDAEVKVSFGDIRSLLIDYLSAMGKGHLEEADRVAAMLQKNRRETLTLLDRIGADEMFSAQISTLPRPVMLGFLRQLRSKL